MNAVSSFRKSATELIYIRAMRSRRKQFLADVRKRWAKAA